MQKPKIAFPPIDLARMSPRHWLAGAAVLAAVAAVGFWVWKSQPTFYTLRFGAREELRFRKDAGGMFHEEAAKHGLSIENPLSNAGADSFHRVASGELDVAMVLTGQILKDPDICQVAFLRGEPLQLFVKAFMVPAGLSALRGKRLHLGPQTGETHPIAEKVLQHIGLRPGVDYLEENGTYTELLNLPPDQFPDAIFVSAPLTSPLGQTLVKQYGMRLVEIPFAEALALRNPTIEDLTIPTHTYGFDPPVPEKPLHTVSTHRMLIANRQVPNKAVERLLEVIYESDFSHRASKPPVDLATASRARRYPLHPGVIDYLRRNDPLIDRQLVEKFSDLKSFLLSAVSSVVLLWSWLRRRRAEGLDSCFHAVSQWEIEAWQAACNGRLDRPSRQAMVARLMELKIAVLEKQRAGVLASETQLAALLARVEDARRSLEAMPEMTVRPAATDAGAWAARNNAA